MESQSSFFFYMNKTTIKVIKRNTKAGEGKSQIPADTLKAESDSRREMGNTVNGWISAQRENSRAEKVFSDNKILAWKIIP